MNDNDERESTGPLRPQSRVIGLNEAYSVKTPDDNRRLYANWAATYETDFVAREKYRYPKAIADLFSQVVVRENIATVVDVGTGTGLTGWYLSRLCPEYLFDGVDISLEMLNEASKKTRSDGSPVYRELFERDLTLPVGETNAPYDALICSGTFTHGHLGPEALDNLLPLVRPHGWFMVGVNNEHFVARAFENKLNRMMEEQNISQLNFTMIHVYEEGSSHSGDQARVLIFRRN